MLCVRGRGWGGFTVFAVTAQGRGFGRGMCGAVYMSLGLVCAWKAAIVVDVCVCVCVLGKVGVSGLLVRLQRSDCCACVIRRVGVCVSGEFVCVC